MGSLPAGVRDEAGFTLVEVLVVVLVIGILAGIAVVSFLPQQEKGHDGVAKEEAALTYRVLVSCITGMDVLGESGQWCIPPGESLPTGVQLTRTGYSYRIVAESPTHRSFVIVTSQDPHGNPTRTRTCSPTGGGCPSSGTW